MAPQVAYHELQDIFEFLPDATLVIDRDKNVLFWNRAMEEMTGTRKMDILGRGDYVYAIPFYGVKRPMLIDLVTNKQPDVEKRYDFIKRIGSTVFGECFVPGAYQGKGAYLWSTAAPLVSEDGGIIGYIQSIRDISDRKKAEEALRQNEEKYRQLFETVADAILVLDGETRQLIDVNEKACRLYGYSREEFLELTYADIIAKPDNSNAPVEKTPSRTPTRASDIYHKRKDATIFPAEISSSTFVLAGHSVLCGVVRDIAERKRTELELSRYRDSLEDLVRERTSELEQSNEKLRFEIMERKRMEEALRESKAYLSATIESIPFQFWVIGQDGRFIMQNRISRESYGDIVGKRPEDVSPNGSTLSVWKDNNRRAFSGELVKEEVRYFFGDEERYYFSVVAPIRDVDTTIGIVGVNVDITDRKLLEAALTRVNEELESLVEKRTKELRAKNRRLEEFNTALRILLKQREEDRRELEESVLSNVKSLIVPYVEKLKRSRLGGDQIAHLAILESHIREIASPFAKTLSERYFRSLPGGSPDRRSHQGRQNDSGDSRIAVRF